MLGFGRKLDFNSPKVQAAIARVVSKARQTSGQYFGPYIQERVGSNIIVSGSIHEHNGLVYLLVYRFPKGYPRVDVERLHQDYV